MGGFLYYARDHLLDGIIMPAISIGHMRYCGLWGMYGHCRDMPYPAFFANYANVAAHVAEPNGVEYEPGEHLIIEFEMRGLSVRIGLEPLMLPLSTNFYITRPTSDYNELYNIASNATDLYGAPSIMILGGQIISLAVLTIGARGVGPRLRPDQLSDLTGKDLLLFLTAILFFALFGMY